MPEDHFPLHPGLGSETAEEAAAADKLVGRLSTVVFLEWLGAGAVLPLLPLYLRQHGASTALVGLTMSSFFLAGIVFQFPAGRLADKIGRRPVLVGGLFIYAASSAAFLLPISTTWFLVLRFIQGGAAGSVEVASLALVAATIPMARRGRAVSRIFSAQLGGTAIGPVLGSIVGVHHMGFLFLTTAVLCSLAAVPVLTSSSIKEHDSKDHSEGPLIKIRASRALSGALVAAVALGLTIGVYEACWSLLMSSRGASSFQVGLSWTLFSLPYVVLVRAGGWAADHADRRLLAIGGLSVAILFCGIYAFVPSVLALLLMAVIESSGFSFAMPAIQGLLTQGRRPQELGRIQGLYATCQTGAIALSAAVSGALFGVGRALPFVSASIVGLILVLVVAVIWSAVPGRTSEVLSGPVPDGAR